MPNQHTKRAERMAAAAAHVMASPSVTPAQRKRGLETMLKEVAPKKRAPTTRKSAQLVTEAPNDLDSNALAADIKRLFQRHGVKVRSVSVSEPLSIEPPRPAPAEPMQLGTGLMDAKDLPASLADKQREVPRELGRAEGVMDIMGTTLADLTRRLEDAGILQPKEETGGNTGEEAPVTSVGTRLRVLSNRIAGADGELRALMRRLEV